MNGIHRESEMFEAQSAKLPHHKFVAVKKELWNRYADYLSQRLAVCECDEDRLVIRYLQQNLQYWNQLSRNDENEGIFSSAGGPDVKMLMFNKPASWMKDVEQRSKIVSRCFKEGTFRQGSNDQINPQEPSNVQSKEEEDVGYTTLTATLEAQGGQSDPNASTTMEAAEPEPDGSLDALSDTFVDEDQQIPMSQLAPINWVHEGRLYNVARGRSGWHMDRDGTDDDHGGYTLTLSGTGSSTQWLPSNVFPAVARFCADDITNHFSSKTADEILQIRRNIQRLQVEFLFKVDPWIQTSGLVQVIPPGNILADYSCFNKLFHRTNMDLGSNRIFLNISEGTFRKLCVRTP